MKKSNFVFLVRPIALTRPLVILLASFDTAEILPRNFCILFWVDNDEFGSRFPSRTCLAVLTNPGHTFTNCICARVDSMLKFCFRLTMA